MAPTDFKNQPIFAETFISLQWERHWPRAKYLEFFESSIGSSNIDKVRTDALYKMCAEMELTIQELGLRATIVEQTSRILWMISALWEGDYHMSHFEIGESLRTDPEQKENIQKYCMFMSTVLYVNPELVLVLHFT